MHETSSNPGAGWHWRGHERPPFAIEPGPGQESVWDYPRPPAIEADHRHVMVVFDGRRIADTRGAVRVLETAGAPTWYLPAADIDFAALVDNPRRTFCEWKGTARYWDVHGANARIATAAAWAYPEAEGRFAPYADYLAFYAAALECFVDDERVRPQPGGFYGGWVTDDVVGPFKGEPGTEGW